MKFGRNTPKHLARVAARSDQANVVEVESIYLFPGGHVQAVEAHRRLLKGNKISYTADVWVQDLSTVLFDLG